MAFQTTLTEKRQLTLDYKTFSIYLHLKQPFNYRKNNLSWRDVHAQNKQAKNRMGQNKNVL